MEKNWKINALLNSGLVSLLQVPGTEKATYLRCSTLPASGDGGLQEARLADRRTQFKQDNRSRQCWDTTEIPTTTCIRKQRQLPGPPNPSRSNDTVPSHNPIPPLQQIETQGWVRGLGSLLAHSHCHLSLSRRQWSKPRQRNLLAAKGEMQYTVLRCWVAPSFCQNRPEPFSQEQSHPAWASKRPETHYVYRSRFEKLLDDLWTVSDFVGTGVRWRPGLSFSCTGRAAFNT